MLVFAWNYSLAQIPDVEVQITNPLKVTLPQIERNFDKIPVKPLEPVYPPLVYGFRNINFTAPAFQPSVRPLRLKDAPQEQIRAGYVSLGYGNYGSPYGDLFLPILQDLKNKRSAALRAFHQSFTKGPIEGKRSGSGLSSIVLDFQSNTRKISSEGAVSFRNNNSNFYGYPEGSNLKNDTLGISYSNISLGLKILNSQKSDFHFSLGGGFSHLWNNRKASESDLKFNFESTGKIGKKGELRLAANYDLLAREDVGVEAKPRNLINTKLLFEFSPAKDMDVELGINTALENDVSINRSFHLYPALHLNWKLAPRLKFEGDLGGQVEKVSLHTLSASNIWLDRNIAISHTNQLLNFSALIRAGWKGGLSAAAGFRYSDLDNLFFFINQPSDSSRFNVTYDDATKVNPFFGFNFQKGKISMELKGDYFLWSTSNLAAAFHRPKGSLEWNSSFSISKKFLFRPYAIVLWGIQAPVAADPALIKELPAATDLGFRLDFNFSDRASVMVRVNNLLSDAYTLLNQYPVRGFQGMAGLTWRF